MRALLLTLVLLIAPFSAHAADVGDVAVDENAAVIESPDTLFRAKVVRVLEERTVPADNGTDAVQQKLELELLEGPMRGRRVEFDGSAIPTIAAGRYREGDRVIVWWSKDPDGTDTFYVTDYVRDTRLGWLALLFAAVVVAVGRARGLRALAALALSAAAIFGVIVPTLLRGVDPILVTVPVSAAAIAVGILLTHGRTRQTAAAVVGVALSLLLTGALAWAFTAWTRITGFGTEEASILALHFPSGLNMVGIYLAGVIVGTLGVLDDVVVSQAAVVEELVSANPGLTRAELFRRAMRVGTDHTAAVVNTLFLAYVGASLPLVLLFSIHEAPFLTFRDVINNEMIASEVVRTLVGSIGLVLTVPITTLVAVRLLRR
ncbi:YibE/F family protein [Patescibacteria group bacterium]|nr:MAG: YibE/F family protein [Patescibacteria group bacterium]